MNARLFAIDPLEQIECARRELAYRRHVYPRLIQKGRMTPERAEREIELMQSILEALEGRAPAAPPRPRETFVFVAAPYSHADPRVEAHRAAMIERYAVTLFTRGIPFYSPIGHFHDLAVRHGLPRDAAPYAVQNAAMLGAASSMHLLRLDGWRESVGLAAERLQARGQGTPIVHIDPATHEPIETEQERPF